MIRGESYRVANPSARDPKKFRVFVVVSRQILIDSRFSTVICAPVYTVYDGLATQVRLRLKEELELNSLRQSAELYAEIYDQDNELHELTESAIQDWPE